MRAAGRCANCSNEYTNTELTNRVLCEACLKLQKPFSTVCHLRTTTDEYYVELSELPTLQEVKEAALALTSTSLGLRDGGKCGRVELSPSACYNVKRLLLERSGEGPPTSRHDHVQFFVSGWKVVEAEGPLNRAVYSTSQTSSFSSGYPPI
jgi:hypothetical protein